MSAGVLLDLALLAAALAVLALGAVTAWTSANAAKRIVGVLIAQAGGALTALALGAPQGVALAGIAAMAASVMLAAAIVVRMQESYQAVDADEIDDADRQSEPND